MNEIYLKEGIYMKVKYRKGWDNLTMEILKKDLEEILRKEMNEND